MIANTLSDQFSSGIVCSPELFMGRNDGVTAENPPWVTEMVDLQHWFCWMCACQISNDLRLHCTGKRHLSYVDRLKERAQDVNDVGKFPTEGPHWPKYEELPDPAFPCWMRGRDPRKSLNDDLSKKKSRKVPAAKVLAAVRVGKKNNCKSFRCAAKIERISCQLLQIQLGFEGEGGGTVERIV